MMNTILTKAIIENSLVLMDCVGGNKDLGYFPQVKKDETLQTPNQISSHRGFRPIFKNIFTERTTTTID